MILLVVGHLPRSARRGIDGPNRSAHRHRDRTPIRRPRRRPRRTARRRWEVVVVHVVAAVAGGGVRALGSDRGREDERECQQSDEGLIRTLSQMHEITHSLPGFYV